MKRVYIIGLFVAVLSLAGMACGLSVGFSPGPASPTDTAPPAIAAPTGTPTAQPSQPASSRDRPGNGRTLFLPLLSRSAAVKDRQSAGAIPVNTASTPSPGSGQPGPGQATPAGELIQPVGVQPQAIPVQVAMPGSPYRPAVYRLKPGEYPYCLARRFDIHPQDLMAFNGFSYRQVFSPGQPIRLPPDARPFPGPRALHPHTTVYTVRPGDSIYSIACDFGDLDPQALLQANPTAQHLKAGIQLLIPHQGANQGIPLGQQAAAPLPTAVQAGGILPLTGEITPAASEGSPAESPTPAPSPLLPPVDLPGAAKAKLTQERTLVESLPTALSLKPVLAVPRSGLAGLTPQALQPITTPIMAYSLYGEAGQGGLIETPTPLSILSAAAPPVATPTLATPPVPEVMTTPLPDPLPNPTRAVPTIPLAWAIIDPAGLQPGVPNGLLPEITYTPYRGGSLIDCPPPDQIVVSASDLSFRAALPPHTYEINMLLNLYSCGWNPGEAVMLDVLYPDGRLYRQDPLPHESELSRYASGSGRVYRLFRSNLGDPPGTYVFILRGTQSPRRIQVAVNIQPPAWPRARAEFNGNDDRTSVIGYTLYGFQPNETFRLVAYQVSGLPVRGQALGWKSLQVDPFGRLYIAVDPAQTGIDYQFIGDQSGQALVSFSRVGLPGAIR